MKPLFILLALLLGLAASAQTGNISGKIQDDKNAAAEFVTVLLLNAADSSLAKGGITDETGQFNYEGIDYGNYLLKVSMLGYTDYYSGPLLLNEGNNSIQLPTIQLSPAAEMLGEVTITAKKPFIEMQNGKLVVNVESSPVAAGGTALEVLKRSPGVRVDKDNNISLQGKQGVVIMIDGKPTQLSGSDVGDLLKTMPANSIDRIEIITNPSAKYDAAGNAGIINIRLKKGKKLGLNGTIDLAGSIGEQPRYDGGVQLNYNEGKINVFGNYSHDNGRYANDFTIDRRVRVDSFLTVFTQDNHQIDKNAGHTFKAGVDWDINPKNVLGVMVDGGIENGVQMANTSNALSGDNTEAFTNLTNNSNIDKGSSRYSGNVYFKHTFDSLGRELTIDADYSRFRDNSDALYTNNYFDANNNQVLPTYLLRSYDRVKVDIKAAKADYVHPFKNGLNLEAGIKSSLVSTDNGISFEERYNETWQYDSTRSNQYIYKENINAAYINLSKQFKGFGLQAGLRMEHTISDGNSVTLNQQLRRSYVDFFPSVALSYMAGGKHMFNLAYNYRIDRPSYQDLNPFIYYLDQYTYGKGNPYLSPQYTHSTTFTYGFQQFFFATLNYSRTTNAMAQLLEQDDVTKATYQTQKNLDHFDNASLTLTAPIPVNKWWNVMVNLTGLYNRYNSYLSGENVTVKTWTYNGFLQNTFTLPKDFSIELSGYYSSSQIWGLISLNPLASVDFGISKSFLDGKLNVKLSVNDIFYTQKFSSSLRYLNIDLDFAGSNDTRRVGLDLTYKFGNGAKPKREHKSASAEEAGRVK